MTGMPCNCCCVLKIEDLPDISISGMVPSGGWTPAGDCCFKRRYIYTFEQLKRVMSVDVQRSREVLTATQIYIAKEWPVLGCVGLFDCARINTVDDTKWIERLGLLYQLQHVDVFIQLKKVTCPGIGEVDRYIVSTRHVVKFRSSFITGTYSDRIGNYTSLATCCANVSNLNYSSTGNEPDWTDATIWPGYASTFSDGEYWNHKLYTTLPSGTSETINGCLAPCTIPNLCTVECEGICLTSEPSEIVPHNRGHFICPRPNYVPRTCTYVYHNTFDGTQNCTSTAEYYRVTPASLCPTTEFYARFPVNVECGQIVARGIGYTTTAFDYATSCVFNNNAEVCLQTPVVLVFPA